MATIISGAEFDAQANPVIVGFVEFDTQAPAAPVIIGWVEFDTQAPPAGPTVIVSLIEFDATGTGAAASQANIGARRSARTSVSTVKSSPPPAATAYHGRSREQEELEQARALELADEEAIITFILEFALV